MNPSEGLTLPVSTAHALLSSPRYAHTHLTILDAYAPPPHGAESATSASISPAPTPASLDTSRIIRADYANAAYSRLGAEALRRWRQSWPQADRVPNAESCSATSAAHRPVYYETGLILCSSAPGASSDSHAAARNDAPVNPNGTAYVRKSLENVRRLAAAEDGGDGGDKVRALHSHEAIAEAWGSGAPAAAHEGYANGGAGWADAASAMARLRDEVARIGAERMRWVQGQAERLLFEKGAGRTRVAGAVVALSGEEIRADLTVLAAGAWAPALLPRSLGPRIRARGQALAYLRPTEDRLKRYRGRVVVFDMGTGIFVIAPPARSAAPQRDSRVKTDADEDLADVTIKLARHGWGYENRTRVPNVEGRDMRDEQESGASSASESQGIEVYVPPPSSTTLPLEGRNALRNFQHEVLPDLADEPFWSTRVCWYADTLGGDFLVDFVPEYGHSLLIAGGGSGHAFKFVPVLGERVLERTEGCLEPELAELWRWRTEEDAAQGWRGEGDGSRGGRKGMTWEDEASRKGP